MSVPHGARVAGRRLLKATLPPILVDWVKKRRHRYCSSFEQAKAKSSSTYQSDNLTRFRIAEAVQNIPLLTSSELPSGYALLVAALTLSKVKRPLICDLGGGCGAWGYRLLQDSVLPFDYQVVEHAGLVAACRAHGFFSWGTWSSELPQEYDVLVCSGTLQYLPDPYELLRRALAQTKCHAVLARTTFSETDYVQVQVSALQHNGHRPQLPPGYAPNQLVRYPHRTVRQSRVLAIAEAQGFDVHLKLQPISSALAPGAFEQDMLLTRRPAPV